jgi:hypothetical protein
MRITSLPSPRSIEMLAKIYFASGVTAIALALFLTKGFIASFMFVGFVCLFLSLLAAMHDW